MIFGENSRMSRLLHEGRSAMCVCERVCLCVRECACAVFMFVVLRVCVCVCRVTSLSRAPNTLQHTVAHCNTLHTATNCNTQQHTATYCSTLQHLTAHCNTLPHITTHCNTLQHLLFLLLLAAFLEEWRQFVDISRPKRLNGKGPTDRWLER